MALSSNLACSRRLRLSRRLPAELEETSVGENASAAPGRVATEALVGATLRSKESFNSNQGEDRMKWITRSHVHVDRIACPWLITRFIDSEAEFLFVPTSQIEKVVKETGAIPYDAPGVELGHVDGRCSFESIIVKYGLKEPGLLRMAKIVHAADVSEDIDTDPIARGLEAIASGYSLRFPEDMENMEHQLEVYDALYAWCRMDVARSNR
jgi:hypothetical protein